MSTPPKPQRELTSMFPTPEQRAAEEEWEREYGALAAEEPGSVPLDNPKFEMIAFMRSEGRSYVAIAAETGWNEKTCRNHGSRTDLKRRIDYLQRERLADARARVNAELMPSIDRIVAVRDSDNAPAQTQLEAATRLAAMAGMTTQARRQEITGAEGGPVQIDELALIRAARGKA